MADFKEVIAHTLKWEAGFVNHPSDPGGATNKGIILVNWLKWGRDLDKDGDIDVDDLKLVSDQDAIAYYKTHFWDKINASQINDQDLAHIIFDFYVNATSVAVPLLQHLLNTAFGKVLAVDGGLGPKTLAAVNSVNADSLYQLYKESRLAYYNYRANNLSAAHKLYSFFGSLGIRPREDQKVFLTGWLNRTLSFIDKKKV